MLFYRSNFDGLYLFNPNGTYQMKDWSLIYLSLFESNLIEVSYDVLNQKSLVKVTIKLLNFRTF